MLTAYAWLTNPAVARDLNVHDTPVTTLIVVGLSAWLIARLFLNVYVVVIDAVLLCFFEDSGSDKPLPTTRYIEGVARKVRSLRLHILPHLELRLPLVRSGWFWTVHRRFVAGLL